QYDIAGGAGAAGAACGETDADELAPLHRGHPAAVDHARPGRIHARDGDGSCGGAVERDADVAAAAIAAVGAGAEVHRIAGGDVVPAAVRVAPRAVPVAIRPA